MNTQYSLLTPTVGSVVSVDVHTHTGWIFHPHARLVINEFMAAFLTIFAVVAARASLAVAPEFVALAAGLALFAVISIFHGATGNPFFLLAGLIIQRVHWLGFLLSMIAQFAGAILAVVFVQYGLLKNVNTAVPRILAPAADWNGFLAEMIVTFFVIITYLLSEYTHHNKSKPFVVGIVLALGGWAIFTISNACINPFYHLTTAIISGIWDPNCWAYYVGDLVGIILAVILVVLSRIRVIVHSNIWFAYYSEKVHEK
jgi:glycerol uptake facilitator-like aquaporin